jgi:aminoglycoside 2''-phosphotransferase
MSDANDLAAYELRIREIVPDIAVTSLALNRDGLMNDVVMVNEELVFRFARHEYAFKHLNDEARILRFLRKYLTLEIPTLLHVGEDFLAYRLIPGVTLRRDQLMRLPEVDQQAIADQLAQFLRELHNIPVDEADFQIPAADALMKYEGWLDAYQRIRDKVFPLLMPHVRESVAEHWELHLADRRNFDYELKMVDTDIPPYHIMFDRKRRRISGIIDFGCAGLGDPAIDFGVIIYYYGESFMDRFYGIYPEAENYLKRARLYAGAHEVRWLLTGIERNDSMWFGVHVGGAKAIGY